MDPLAHTLVGACLAETRLGRVTPFATSALVLGANAPDIDAVTMLIDGDLALGFRRGWTHGVLALLVLPAVVTSLVLALDQLARRLSPEREPANPRLLLAVSAVAVWTHPLLDWLNTYGIRLLMPLDDRWFYGDTLFIVDPWLWLMAGAPAVLAGSRGRFRIRLWVGTGLFCSAVVLFVPFVPTAARVAWCAGIALILLLRANDRLRPRVTAVAACGLACLSIYVAAMHAASGTAAALAETYLQAQGIAPSEVMAGPAPANPFAWQIVAREPDRYHLLEVRLLAAAGDRVRARRPPLPVGPTGPIVDAALRAEHVEGLVEWLRFPTYRVEPSASGYRVFIEDVRGIGNAVVELDAALRVVPPLSE